MAVTVYNEFLFDLAKGTIDLSTADIRCLITLAAYVPDPDTNFVSQVTNELVATNYVRKTLAGKTVTRDDTNDRVVFTATNVVWTALGSSIPFRVVLFKFVTNDADSRLIACLDLISPPVANGGDYTVAWSANGIIRLRMGP